MKTYSNIYKELYSFDNLIQAYKKARKGKTKKDYVKEFKQKLNENLLKIQSELKTQTYQPEQLKTFILRDPKTRKISKSAFRDRIVHHALVNILQPIYEKLFIFDSYTNRKGKGTLLALKRFDLFKRKVTCNLSREAACLKADIKHYFAEVEHNILLRILKRKIADKRVIWLIEKILGKFHSKEKGMPLGNLTSQFFANIYLNELDYFVKHKLKAKYYIRYVDDFVLLHNSPEQLENWKDAISFYLQENLKLELHPEKSNIRCLSRGIDFVGFRNFNHHRLLRKRNIRKMLNKVIHYKKEGISKARLLETFQGWQAYAKWADTYKLRRRVVRKIYSK